MGGSSGVLLSIFFTATGQKLAEGDDFAAALGEGLERIRFYGGAAPGDRTLIDALAPAIAALGSRYSRRCRPRRRLRRDRHRRHGAAPAPAERPTSAAAISAAHRTPVPRPSPPCSPRWPSSPP